MARDRLLAHQRVVAPGSEPGRWMYVLHGVYGAGRNWATVARRIVEARQDWGALLVDLRKHGGSQDFPPPHDLASCAADLRDLATGTRLEPAAVLGHSFGGKVALVYARDHGSSLESCWAIDASPAARAPGGGAWSMMSVLRRVPDRFGSREDAVAALEGKGIDTPVARWMVTNLTATDDGDYRWRFDLDSIEELLRSFFQEDLWDVLARPPGSVRIHLVKAEGSDVLGEESAARIEAVARATGGRVALHRLEGGHWLNADNPDGLVGLVRDHL